MTTVEVNVPLNRVEGDLEVRARIEDGVVAEAWCSGTMFRGFEQILVGRGAMEALLVITPRICGICGTAHLTCAARALESIALVDPPPDAKKLRSLALMTEHVQSDVRHAFLMFAADFTVPAYASSPLHAEALRRYEPFRGEAVVDVIRETRKVLELVAIVGGQWPHSSYMVPGGVASTPSASELLQCQLLVERYRRWYEKRVLGCELDRWLEVRSEANLEAWLEVEAHAASEVGFFIRFAKSAGLDHIGAGPGRFLSFGSIELPEGTVVRGPTDDAMLVPAGFARGVETASFDHQHVAEHVASSWFIDYEGGRHPFEGETRPYATGQEGGKYSWAKSPRYDGEPAETGPLAEAIVAGNPLFADLVGRHGPNVLSRHLARLTRATKLLPTMELWLSTEAPTGESYITPGLLPDGSGFGAIQATRGALGHWVEIRNGKIAHYQIITPTAWNMSPRDSAGTPGPVEQALVGTPVRDPEDPIELGHVVRSFDACLVCTVHAVGRGGRTLSRRRLGLGA